jgi:hypothetical protein
MFAWTSAKNLSCRERIEYVRHMEKERLDDLPALLVQSRFDSLGRVAIRMPSASVADLHRPFEGPLERKDLLSEEGDHNGLENKVRTTAETPGPCHVIGGVGLYCRKSDTRTYFKALLTLVQNRSISIAEPNVSHDVVMGSTVPKDETALLLMAILAKDLITDGWIKSPNDREGLNTYQFCKREETRGATGDTIMCRHALQFRLVQSRGIGGLKAIA